MSVTTRRMQFVFVNDRPVESLLIKTACREAYKGMAERGSHPLIFLFLDIDPSEVDVNIHPSKKEIKFKNEKSVQSEITSSIVDVLRSSVSKSIRLGSVANLPSVNAETDSLIELTQMASVEKYELEVLDDTSVDVSAFDFSSFEKKLTQSIDCIEEKTFEILGILLNKYIVLQSKEGLVLLHKRAAHERIPVSYTHLTLPTIYSV